MKKIILIGLIFLVLLVSSCKFKSEEDKPILVTEVYCDLPYLNITFYYSRGGTCIAIYNTNLTLKDLIKLNPYYKRYKYKQKPFNLTKDNFGYTTKPAILIW